MPACSLFYFYKMENAVLIFTGIIGAVVTFFINVKLKQGPVRGSALPSLVVALLFYFFPKTLNPYLTENIPLVFFGASFIGMVSSKVLSNYYLLALSGALFGTFFINSSEFFQGYGGSLGTTAAISLLFSLGIVIFSKSKNLQKVIGFKKRE